MAFSIVLRRVRVHNTRFTKLAKIPSKGSALPVLDPLACADRAAV
jgi:hypothetical protein